MRTKASAFVAGTRVTLNSTTQTAVMVFKPSEEFNPDSFVVQFIATGSAANQLNKPVVLDIKQGSGSRNLGQEGTGCPSVVFDEDSMLEFDFTEKMLAEQEVKVTFGAQLTIAGTDTLVIDAAFLGKGTKAS